MIARWRAHAQLLHRPGLGVVETVRHLLAVQAQDISAYPLALRARVPGITTTDVRAAIQDRSLVRLWGPRGTIHLVCADDLPWLFPLVRTGPAASMRRLRQLGSDGTDAVGRVRRALAGQGPLTKAELGERLGAEGQTIVHLAMLAAREGLVVLGPDATYIWAADWLGGPIPTDRDDRAPAELARRYQRAHARSEPADLAAWAGVPLRDIAWHPVEPEPPGEPVTRLIPAYDEYLLGWRSRDFAVPEPYRKVIHPGGGVVRAALIVDGLVAGPWTRDTVEPADELADVRRFQGENPPATRGWTTTR